MLFLGAGASAALGIPTIEGFTDKIIASLDNNEWKNELLAMKNRLLANKERWDIEIVTTALTLLSDRPAMRGYNLPLLAISDEIPEPKPHLSILIDEIKKRIYENCMNFDRKAAGTLFKQLRSALNKEEMRNITLKRRKSPWGDFLRFGKGIYQDEISNKVFTTNYDITYETSLIWDGINDYRDGFEQHGQSPVFNNNWEENKIHLAKLHGSVNYYSRLKDDAIVKYPGDLRQNGTNVFGERLERMMIYPIGEKYVIKTPYFQLLQKFREDLSKEGVVVIIGYSFRDDPINNALIERIIRNDPIKLVIVAGDPANAIKNNIQPKFQSIFQQVATLVKTHFGTEKAIEEISHAVEYRECGDGF